MAGTPSIVRHLIDKYPEQFLDGIPDDEIQGPKGGKPVVCEDLIVMMFDLVTAPHGVN